MASENPDDLARALLALGSATLGESGGKPMHPRIAAAWPGAAATGPAFTVSCSTADNLAIHAAVAEAPAGSVLVVATDPPERGYWGEVLTTAAETRGIRGLVIDGGVRDVAALEAHRFPVFSALIALPGATKVSGGEIGGVVRVGDVEVHTGDWVVGDRDGAVVIAGDELTDTLERARARAAKESAMFAKLREGATTVELLGLDAASVTRR
jgi:4-hydroxy-4-methyl-2-oxoglutarate aldolase